MRYLVITEPYTRFPSARAEDQRRVEIMDAPNLFEVIKTTTIYSQFEEDSELTAEEIIQKFKERNGDGADLVQIYEIPSNENLDEIFARTITVALGPNLMDPQ